MTRQPPVQRQAEFESHIHHAGPMTLNQATEYVRLNNMHIADPQTLALQWLKAALDACIIRAYRNGRAEILYGRPGLKIIDRPHIAPPIQVGLFSSAPSTTTQLAAQAAALATLTEQPRKPGDPLLCSQCGFSATHPYNATEAPGLCPHAPKTDKEEAACD